jgi:transglutaminase-like putative cysteine protease
MSAGGMLSRSALIWLCIGQVMVLLPHLERVPLWIGGFMLLAVLYRIGLFRTSFNPLSRLFRVLLMFVTTAGVIASYRTLIGLEPMVALLVSAAALKVLESYKDRDGYLLVSLAFFICVTNFLFAQSLPVVIYGLVTLMVLVVSLIALNQVPGSAVTRSEFFLAGRLLLFALPMMLVLFVLFPRIDPLWSIPSKSGQGITGMSDSIRLGDVSRLGRSAEVAFRAQFSDTPPARSDLYWRGIVIDQYEGGTWRRSAQSKPRSTQMTLKGDDSGATSTSYRVILQPTMQRWLYALPIAESNSPGVVATGDLTIESPRKIENQFGYEVTSWAREPKELAAMPSELKRAMAYPEKMNPMTRDLVTDLRAQYPEPSAYVSAVLQYFRELPFYYTLSPSLLNGQDQIDRFLFETREGFCEHYASAFVVMMRLAGIPARIVAGYQGGELNPLNNAITVRQFDAHAWAEVWLPNLGWQRVDPTAAVSPDRVRLGLEAALAGESDFLSGSPLALYRFRHVAVLDWLRIRYDALAFQWQTAVVGFNNRRQLDLLTDWFGEIKVSWFTLILLGSWAVVLAPLSWIMNRNIRRSARIPAEEQFVVVATGLAKRGFGWSTGESPQLFLQRMTAVLESDDRDLEALQKSVKDLYQP